MSLKNHLKYEIIVHVLDYIESKGEAKEHKLKAIPKLKELAKIYHIQIRRKNSITPVKNTLRKFILNKEGYSETIPNLTNSLLEFGEKL